MGATRPSCSHGALSVSDAIVLVRDLGRAVPRVPHRRRREHEQELPLALKKIGETFGDRDPATITAAEIAEWIAELAETRKPGTLAST